MKYLIILACWDGEEMVWKILHYSHRFTDAEHQLAHLQEKYPHSDIRMMVDIKQYKNEEAKKKLYEAIERFKKRKELSK